MRKTKKIELFHVTGWHKDGSSSHALRQDWGYHKKESLGIILKQALLPLGNEDQVIIQKTVVTIHEKLLVEPQGG